MISVTRLDGREFTLNADLIETIESNPDTFIRLHNGTSFVVRESAEQIIDRVVSYRRRIFQCGMRSTSEDALLDTTDR
jgi:flagellar protein FlbD